MAEKIKIEQNGAKNKEKKIKKQVAEKFLKKMARKIK